jgi:hypothetical protein
MSRAANAPNPIPLDTASYPAADGTPLVTADDWFAACTSALLRGLAVAASSSAPLPRRAPRGYRTPEARCTWVSASCRRLFRRHRPSGSLTEPPGRAGTGLLGGSKLPPRHA